MTFKPIFRRSLGEVQKPDFHHGLPRWARWLQIKIEDLARLPKGARLLLLNGNSYDEEEAEPEG